MTAITKTSFSSFDIEVMKPKKKGTNEDKYERTLDSETFLFSLTKKRENISLEMNIYTGNKIGY